ncbi:MAG TPA: LysR family transcriptional regulator, partial [Xanthobacteraceae bacterium]|nr:LysR family transcriptional regulator [Xanthobacteraceae bacterium]
QMSLPIQRAHLDGLVVFVAVAELRGFRAAARQLGVTPSAISQTIRALEQRVGAPLLSRTTRSVGLTEAGERLLVHARPAMEMLSLGLDAAASLGDHVSGRLRINLPRAVLPLLANRLLPDFLEAYPNVQLELCGDDNFIDIVEQGFDAGIRYAGFVPTDMIAVPLTPRIRFAVIAAASYVRKRGRPSRPRELEQFNCIQLRRSTGSIFEWDFVEDGKPVRVPINGSLIVNDVEVCLRAVLRGVGFARLPISLVMSYIEKGELETALDEYAVEVPGLMLYYPSRSQSLPKLRAFADFVQKRMRRHFRAGHYHFRAGDYLPTVSP